MIQGKREGKGVERQEKRKREEEEMRGRERQVTGGEGCEHSIKKWNRKKN